MRIPFLPHSAFRSSSSFAGPSPHVAWHTPRRSGAFSLAVLQSRQMSAKKHSCKILPARTHPLVAASNHHLANLVAVWLAC